MTNLINHLSNSCYNSWRNGEREGGKNKWKTLVWCVKSRAKSGWLIVDVGRERKRKRDGGREREKKWMKKNGVSKRLAIFRSRVFPRSISRVLMHKTFGPSAIRVASTRSVWKRWKTKRGNAEYAREGERRTGIFSSSNLIVPLGQFSRTLLVFSSFVPQFLLVFNGFNEC